VQRDVLHTVDFRLVNDKVIVRARVNGGGEMDFIVDTGRADGDPCTTASRQGVTPIA
jgi:hypothetical protein